jgi:hypothetical protein
MSQNSRVTNEKNREILGRLYTLIPKERRYIAKVYAYFSLKTNKDGIQNSLHYSKQKSEDYINKLLRQKPCEIEK